MYVLSLDWLDLLKCNIICSYIKCLVDFLVLKSYNIIVKGASFMVSVAIVGYGNLGRGVECAIKQNDDIHLTEPILFSSSRFIRYSNWELPF